MKKNIFREIFELIILFILIFSIIFNILNFNGIITNIKNKFFINNEEGINIEKTIVKDEKEIEKGTVINKEKKRNLFDKHYYGEDIIKHSNLFFELLGKNESIDTIEYEILKDKEVKDNNVNIKTLYTLSRPLTKEEKEKYGKYEEGYMIIPKINVEAPIKFPSIETRDIEKDILKLLKEGVVHRPETQLPNQKGNFFIMGHSSNYFWETSKYSYIFAKLDLLETGDIMKIIYKGKLYTYEVYNSEIVDPSQIEVYNYIPGYNSTLMTCYPVGTDKQRLVIKLKLKKIFNKSTAF